jgi:hypothetical protein
MGVCWKAAHVVADLGEERLRSQRLNARDGICLLDGDTKGRDAGLHLPIDFGDGGIDPSRMKSQQEAVVPRSRPRRASRKVSCEALTR